MSLRFAVARRRTGFLDPFNGFAPKELTVEVRTDPLTGDLARILQFRARPLGPVDHSDILAREQMKCPFCPDNIEPMTTRFLPKDLPQGRLTRGEATLFPNAFPYEAFNAVIVLSRAHYLRQSQFTPQLLADGLLLAREGFKRLAKKLNYASVNWNYLMPAGAGLIHPHFQIAAGKEPTRFQAGVLTRSKAWARKHPDQDIATAYVEAERAEGSRWVGRLGPAGWMASFAPRAIFDVMALVPGGRTLLELSPAQVTKLAQGICRVLAYFEERGVAYHNMALHTGLQPGSAMPLMLKLVSRIDIPPMGVDEINYFEKLHDEMLTFMPPETVAEEIREMWG